jgi:hypothetical protein
MRPDPGPSWMLPEAKKKDLAYVSDQSTLDVYVFSYPGGKLEGTITGFPQWPSGLCVDQRQDVWVTLGLGAKLVEFPHGGTTPIGVLNDPGQEPIGCSVERKTGDVAAASLAGGITIYSGGTGSGTTYTDPQMPQVWACGYDKSGNLFVDGKNASGVFQFAELPKGSHSLANISLDVPFVWPGGVQWDGKHIAVGDAKADVVYRTTGASGRVVGTTELGGASTVGQFWKVGSAVVASSYDTGTVGIWHYPAGGTPEKVLSGFAEPFGVAVSKGF